MSAHPDPRPIGMFDSGEGGLTVLKRARDLYPGENYLYAADSGHFPYGSRSLSQVREFFLSFLDFFLSHNVKAIVIACNTATAAALEIAQEISPVPVIGVIQPGVVDAIHASKSGVIGILSTEATYQAGVYPNALKALNPQIKSIAHPCPILVTMVESGQTSGPQVENRVRQCTHSLLSHNADTVILGCTHFPHMEHIFRKVINGRAVIIDPGLSTARLLPSILGPLNTTGEGSMAFYTTGDPKFALHIARILWPDLAEEPRQLLWEKTSLKTLT
ncbi:MAG: glutamate racemase [Sulfobacillus benefaciens]|uniref:Glutamate racemase n=1 Tax=Sulfobacillus benefaciens TaxID=453960 RepID=A0A2T2XF57_9FIRM|nr:MAG: glutamate racemase [Sulfobacillus benefaciens]